MVDGLEGIASALIQVDASKDPAAIAVGIGLCPAAGAEFSKHERLGKAIGRIGELATIGPAEKPVDRGRSMSDVGVRARQNLGRADGAGHALVHEQCAGAAAG